MTLAFSLVLAQGSAPAAPRPPDQTLGMLMPMIFIFVIFYFLLIRPQRKRQQELEAQIKALKTGDKVVTSGGIHGVVANVRSHNEPTLTLKIGSSLNIEVDKSAIGRVIRDTASDVKA